MHKNINKFQSARMDFTLIRSRASLGSFEGDNSNSKTRRSGGTQRNPSSVMGSPTGSGHTSEGGNNASVADRMPVS